MSEYNRATRECSVSQLHPELLQAIQNYFLEHKLGHLESETLLCCETVSRRKNAGKTISWLNGNPDTTVHMAMLLTSERLIWVQSGDKTGIRLNAAQLDGIRAEYYNAPFSKDISLEIIGFVGDAGAHVRGSIGMGPEPAAQKFCEEVRQATIKANPPKKGWFRWLGG